jgi:phenylpropionate dioxygenase-like ring-hydroxylating dioxygenase large terminal subunit
MEFGIFQNWRCPRQNTDKILNFSAKFITPVTNSSRDVDHIVLRLPYNRTALHAKTNQNWFVSFASKWIQNHQAIHLVVHMPV